MVNHSDVMRRAWTIFSETYGFPFMPFASIGRKCFGSALAMAWDEARETARLAAMTIEDLAGQISAYEAEMNGLRYCGWGTDVTREGDRIRAAMRPLLQELSNRPLAAVLRAAA